MYLAWLGNKASVKQKMQLLRNLLYHFSEDEVRWKEKHRHRKGLYVHTRARVCVCWGRSTSLVSFLDLCRSLRFYSMFVAVVSNCCCCCTDCPASAADASDSDSETLADMGDQLSL